MRAIRHVLKPWLLVATTLGAVGANFACDAEPNAAERAALRQSRSAWENLKATSSGGYRYTVETNSWTGYKATLVVEVRNDVVVSEAYTATDSAGQVTHWIEMGADVGSHDGMPAPTVEAVYDACEKDVLTRDPATNEIRLSFGNPDGVLSACVYTPLNCADDCTFGPRIGTLELL
jgi:hypothetical protein